MDDRLPGTTWDNPVWHGRWRIYVADAESRQNYEFVHDDYDGAPDANDKRIGHAQSVEEAMRLIDEEYDPKEVPDSVDFGAPRARYKWHTPDGDALVAHMARVSNTKAQLGDPGEKLIGFLIRNHHWSPFEMVNLCVEIHTERDISAQILRHSKEFRFQEFSTRYAEVEDLRWSTECRFQDVKNKQNSFEISAMLDAGAAKDETEATIAYFDAVVNESRTRSLEAYQELLRRGVAKECARRILPFGLTPTVMYINSNLRGWIHYLAERTKPGVQKEHREIALAVEPLFAEHFPQVWAAVQAYRAEEAKNNWRIEQMKQIEAVLTEFFGGEPKSDPVNLLKELLKDC